MRSLMNTQNRSTVSDPFRAIEEMMDEVWRGWPSRFASGTAQPVFRPAMDLVEDENAYTVRLDLPGLESDNVRVEIEDNTLTISGEMGDTVEQEGDRYHYRERYVGAFQRSVRLPNTLNAEKVEANFENGVLNIVLPKRPEAQPRQIKIATGKK